ncbi:hypothetical protein UFOVP449_262 [uncultured Caudovirales phage]|uniref:Uncharacterized protein n=1 Tax=uncultured Caudovirales phage TaxID=2100421 RepID=A0A6J5MEE9_9CAUD|nr:hypothetical protein UFOVP449_262 [uncultured Caudovirales phage]
MKARILKIVSELKELVREMDENGVSENSLDDVYDKLNQIEDEIYEDDTISDAYEENENY